MLSTSCWHLTRMHMGQGHLALGFHGLKAVY